MLTRVFLARTGSHPRIKSEGMLRSKTLCRNKPAIQGLADKTTSSHCRSNAAKSIAGQTLLKNDADDTKKRGKIR
jgi:hypothetical protein